MTTSRLSSGAMILVLLVVVVGLLALAGSAERLREVPEDRATASLPRPARVPL